MDPHYNQNYTKEEISSILARIKRCVSSGRYTISLNSRRQENINFINEYNIRRSQQERILMQIQVEDFCHSLKNTKPGYESEILYVFAPNVQLYNACGEEELVDVYTKFNILSSKSGYQTIVVSFHELNRPIAYAFR